MSPTCPSVTVNFYDNKGKRTSEPLLLYLIYHMKADEFATDEQSS